MRKMERGASIIIHKWVRLKPWDRLLIVTSKEYEQEAKALRRQASTVTRSVSVLLVENKGMHVGMFFDDNEEIFDPYTTIIAATEYSLVTTKAAKRAIRRHKKFLSLPLSTNDGRSMLRYDFLMMDTKKSRMLSKVIMKYLKSSSRIRITTPAGTDLTVEKRGRGPGFFNGVLKDSKDYSSASIEVYVPIEETRTNGVIVVDGSLGYIGRAEDPVRVRFEAGEGGDQQAAFLGGDVEDAVADGAVSGAVGRDRHPGAGAGTGVASRLAAADHRRAGGDPPPGLLAVGADVGLHCGGCGGSGARTRRNLARRSLAGTGDFP